MSELANFNGGLILGAQCHLNHGAIVRGDFGRIIIGDGTAVEEGGIIHAPPGDTQTITGR